MRVVIVDDEQLGIDSLKWELARIDVDIEIVQTFTDAKKASAYLKEAEIDLLFSDIQMPKLNGFDLLKEIGDIRFQVIFVTAYDEYAIQAFKYSALDYLLKPVDKTDLALSLSKYQEKNIGSSNSKLIDRIGVQQSIENGHLPESVVFATKDTYEFVNPKDIMYCEALNNYAAIYTIENKLVISKTLKEVEVMLEHFGFLRIHRSYLVNPSFIKRYVKTLGGSLIIKNGVELSISKSKKEAVLEFLHLS